MIKFLLLASLVNAQPVSIDSFCGLNNSIPAAAIQTCEAQDALNVEANRGGLSLKKRDGFTKVVQVSSLTAINSLFVFQNSNGNDVFLTVDDEGYVERSQNLGTPTSVSTITKGAYLNCASNEGKAWCFTTDNDQAFSYDGSTLDNEVSAGYPNGKFNAFTQDRQLVAGTTDFPNRLYISKSGDFNQFVTGTDKIDAWTEDIGRNGDKITSIAFCNGRVMVGKSQSMGGFNLTDQFNSTYYDISSRVGIVDHQAQVVHEGVLYWKGSDNHFYASNCGPGNIVKLSGKIRRSIAAILTGKNRLDIQTDKADWDAGNLTAAGLGAPIRSDITNGSIQGATVTIVDTSSTNFAAGTLSSLSVFDTIGSLTLSSTTVGDDWNDGNYTSNPAWTSDSDVNWSVEGGNLRQAGSGTQIYTASTISTGSWRIANRTANVGTTSRFKFMSVGTSLGSSAGYALELGYPLNAQTLHIEIREYPADTAVCSTNVARDEAVFYTWTVERNESGDFLIIDEDGLIVLDCNDTTVNSASNIILSATIGASAGSQSSRWDDLTSVEYSTTGVFTSRIYDTNVSSPVGGLFTVSSGAVIGITGFSTNTTTGLDIDYYLRVSTNNDGGGFNSYSAITNEGFATWGRRYGQLVAIFNTDYSSATPSINILSLVAATTGQYITKCIEPGSGISAWGVLDMAGTQPGNSSLSYEISTGNDCDNLGSYISISTGVALGVAVKAALKYRLTWDIKSSTEEARIDSITTRWTEGSLAPTSFAGYWNDAIYFSYSTGTSANNRVAKFDLTNPGFYIYELGMNSPVSFRETFYFGSTDTAHISKYSDIDPDKAPTSDAGSPIHAYWRTKSFSGGDPYTETIWNKISFIARQESGGNLDLTWRLDGGAINGTFSIDLSTGTNTVRHNEYLEDGQRGTFIDIEYMDDSTEPFEVLGTRIDGHTQPWRPLPNKDGN